MASAADWRERGPAGQEVQGVVPRWGADGQHDRTAERVVLTEG